MPAIPRKPRTSLPAPPAGMEDISHLTLAEIQARLERNNRVLGTSLFSTSPSTSNILSTSPHSPRNTLGGGFNSGSSTDPVRDRLLAARQALLAREQELLLEQGVSKMEMDEGSGGDKSPIVESSADARRRSSAVAGVTPVRSGKARAVESIKATEGGLHPNGIILPYDQSLALGEKEFDKATADKLANMSIQPPSRSFSPAAPGSPSASSAPRRKKYDPTDEIARAQANARAKAFMSYKPSRPNAYAGPGDGPDDFDEDGDGDVEDGIFEDDWGMEGEYDGDGDKFVLGSQGREPMLKERGTGEEVDQMGEDDEAWAEGNDDYLDMNR